MQELETELNKVYDVFFNTLDIDKTTGIVNNIKSNKRFATKIAIGKNYLSAQKKILFVSLDIGKDENFVDKKQNNFQDFEQRRNSVCNIGYLNEKNPHMAGVYGTALYFLSNYNNWMTSWKLLESTNNFFKEALITNKEVLPQDVLSNISLINFYNFVTVGRETRTGGNDRNFINEKIELELLTNIIKTINPDIIVVQSKTLSNYFKNIIKPNIPDEIDIYIGYHPSVFGRGIKYRNPKKYIENLLAEKI
mgnify:CR=1 FL=1